jgi:hypothetical protein
MISRDIDRDFRMIMIMRIRIRTDTLIDRYRLRTNVNTGYARADKTCTRALALTRAFNRARASAAGNDSAASTAGAAARGPPPPRAAIDHSMMAIPRRGSGARS